jgi:putative flippase GtrA
MLNKIFKDKTDNTAIQLFRSIIAGAIAFAVDFGTLFILTEYFHIYYLISSCISFIFGVTTVYILSVIFVFKARAFKNRALEFGIFAFIGVIGLGLNQLILWFFTEKVHFHYLASKVVATAIVFLWNFFSRKFILYSNRG